jgi:phosphotransferase family enzyme
VLPCNIDQECIGAPVEVAVVGIRRRIGKRRPIALHVQRAAGKQRISVDLFVNDLTPAYVTDQLYPAEPARRPFPGKVHLGGQNGKSRERLGVEILRDPMMTRRIRVIVGPHADDEPARSSPRHKGQIHHRHERRHYRNWRACGGSDRHDASVAVEEPLAGGVVNTVVRVGSTVRRSTGPWTPAVHALLDHLHAAGFSYAPQVLGTDAAGREMLTYIDGISGLRPWPDVLRRDEGLVQVGNMLRELTNAIANFQPPPGAQWRTSPPVAGPVRHGDLGMWNTIWRGDRLVGLIDWDFAEPAPPLWDLAQAAWYGIPLFRGDSGWKDCGFSAEPDRRHRLAVLCDAYGADPAAVLDALADLQALELDRVQRLGGAGITPFDAFLARGDATELAAEQHWLAANRDHLVKERRP